MKKLLSFLFLLVLLSCTRDEDEPAVTDLPFFFIGNINGQAVGFGPGPAPAAVFSNEPFEQVDQFRPDSFHVFEGTRIYNGDNAFPASATVSIMRVFDHAPSATERATIADTGYYRYAFSEADSRGGASVRFVDGNGMNWSTENHPQADTSFRIELLNPAEGSNARAVFQARFRCRLFNAAGDSINLENGSVRGLIIKP